MTGESVANLQRIGQGKQDFGFTMAGVARGAENGLGKLKNHKAKARTLMVPFPRKVQVATTEGWAIEKLADFKGKRMSISEPDRGTEVLAVCAVIAAPVLTRPGVPDCAAPMFIFYWREQGPHRSCGSSSPSPPVSPPSRVARRTGCWCAATGGSAWRRFRLSAAWALAWSHRAGCWVASLISPPGLRPSRVSGSERSDHVHPAVEGHQNPKPVAGWRHCMNWPDEFTMDRSA